MFELLGTTEKADGLFFVKLSFPGFIFCFVPVSKDLFYFKYLLIARQRKLQSSTLDQCQLFRGERKSPTLTKKKSETICEPVLICVSKQLNHLHEKQKQGTVLGFLGKKYFMQGVDALP